MFGLVYTYIPHVRTYVCTPIMLSWLSQPGRLLVKLDADAHPPQGANSG